MGIQDDKQQLELLNELLNGDIKSAHSWHSYVMYVSKYMESHKSSFVKLLNMVLQYVDYNSNRDNPELIDILLLLVNLQKYVLVLLL